MDGRIVAFTKDEIKATLDGRGLAAVSSDGS